METLIVYFSLNGNSAETAEKLASALNADKHHIEPKKNYPAKGFMKFLVGGGDVAAKRRPPLEPYSLELSKYGRVVFVGPVWASNFAPPVGTFIDENIDALRGKRIACAFCHAGGGTEKAVEKLKNALGIEAFEAELSLVDPKTRPNGENEALIKEFCAKLLSE